MRFKLPSGSNDFNSNQGAAACQGASFSALSTQASLKGDCTSSVLKLCGYENMSGISVATEYTTNNTTSQNGKATFSETHDLVTRQV